MSEMLTIHAETDRVTEDVARQVDDLVTVDVLGIKYQVIKNIPDDQMIEGADGYCDPSEKRIYIARLADSSNPGVMKNLPAYINSVIRHEIIHAFLFESGLWASTHGCEAWAMNEEMVDWLAIQFPKLFAAFIEVGCM